MSRIIEVSNTVIKQPELLPTAIEVLNDLKKYEVIKANFVQDKDGRITSGVFHFASAPSVYGRGHILLRYSGKGEPVYTPEGVLQSGHFTLMADEDFQENQNLATLISDHYNAQIIKDHFERAGHNVEMTYNEDGGIRIEATDNEVLAASSY